MSFVLDTTFLSLVKNFVVIKCLVVGVKTHDEGKEMEGFRHDCLYVK